MDYQLTEIGNEHQKLLVFDDFTSSPDALVSLAKTFAPFPYVRENSYPGQRLILEPSHGPQVHAYIDGVCNTLLPIMKEAFGIKGFAVNEASFSMVTAPPQELMPRQKVPHYDTFHMGTFAVLHYLCDTRHGGTAFYRHSTTGFEMITPERRQLYEQALAIDLDLAPPGKSYFNESNETFVKIHQVEAVFNRLVLYRSACLHSGILGEDPIFSDDPVRGRLTTNIFLHTR